MDKITGNIDFLQELNGNILYGETPHQPKIIDGYWYVWNEEIRNYVNTEVKAQGGQGIQGQPGEDGETPTIVRLASNVVCIPCDENGLCKESFSSRIVFEGIKGAQRINCRCLENHPIDYPATYRGF